MTQKDFYPQSIAHLKEPYLTDIDEKVVIAEISSQPINGYRGYRQVHTALIPFTDLDEVLNASGGIGYQVESWGPLPCVKDNQIYDGSFYVLGEESSNKRYETLINTWNYNNTVLLPDNSLLMTYGLIPRYLQDGITYWDEPGLPEYGVLEVKSLSNYQFPSSSDASIVIKKKYLEDYLHLKKCAAVAVFYEERYSSGDQSFDKVLGDRQGRELVFPGRRVALIKVEPEHNQGATQFTRIWGCRLIIKPSYRPITDETLPPLKWENISQSVNLQNLSYVSDNNPLIYVYVEDKALQFYEGKDEFCIFPKEGCIEHSGGWWDTGSYSYRVGRNHIAYHLRKLYEGTPNEVIQHLNQFSVHDSVAEQDKAIHGNRHIGTRAKDVVYSYLELIESLNSLSLKLNLSFTNEEIGSHSRDDVKRRGYWTINDFKRLSYIAPLEMTFDQFSDRCTELYKIFENLKPKPLKKILEKLGMEKKNYNQFGCLRLLGTICQLAHIATENGDDLIRDSEQIVGNWDENVVLEALTPIFKINGLRVIDSHKRSSDSQIRLQEAFDVFEIDSNAMRQGWGYALDHVYDKLAQSLKNTEKIINNSFSLD